MMRFLIYILLTIKVGVCFSDTLPQYPDIVYAHRISILDNETPLDLDYNEFVRSYIEAYAVKNRDKVSRIMGLAKYYFPVFEQYLDKYNLPYEIKYLAAVESALDPNAVSKSGAVGLWQIMKHTADLLDLQCDSYIDERRDLYLSTEAACRYLEYLYRTFGDWNLALAAYNGGPGMVKKAIARSGGSTNYWEIRPYLTQQMQNYVPAFIAMNYVLRYASYHNITEEVAAYNFYNLDTLNIKGPVSFEALAEAIKFPIDSITLFNPMFSRNYIPSDKEYYPLVLPINRLLKFLETRDTIDLAVTKKLDYSTIIKSSGSTENKIRLTHIVKKGETFHKIAMNYYCTVDDIYLWNNLDNNHHLKFDETLYIWIDPPVE
jgi:membrane-bound lytic murein transglycosylase D